MNRKLYGKKITVIFLTILFLTTIITPNITGEDNKNKEQENEFIEKSNNIKNSETNIDYDDFGGLVSVNCYNFGIPGKTYKKSNLNYNDAVFLYDKIKNLQIQTNNNPNSPEIQNLQYEIFILAEQYNLLPDGVSIDQIISEIDKKKENLKTDEKNTPHTEGIGREFLCTFISSGSGGLLPILVLPRFIPFIMTPIPRLFMIWRAYDAVTSCGGLRSNTGFIAYGAQKGLALGFWGIGFTFSIPPVMGVFGLIGYSLYSNVESEYIEFYPPNSPPVISQIDPGDGAVNVPLSLSELRFQILDADGDLMSYTVTTNPDIGSGGDNLVSDGIYSIPVSGLEELTKYSWHVEVTDGKDTVFGDYSFTTVANAPVVSNPVPFDGKRYVPIDTDEVSFHLKDFQGDPIDYSVETVPDIGSDSGYDVGEGTYSVDISGLDYSVEYVWFVNASDGIHDSHKVFSFQCEHELFFDPFDNGWMYRKEITVDHSLVDGDLEDFAVLISCVDVDLRDKAQLDGDDILFMDNVGVAYRLFHEIEDYDGVSGGLVAWVNLPDLSGSVDSVFYMYYGNTVCDDQQAPEFVWNEDYLTILHMNDNPDPSHILDSTFYGRHGTKKGSNEPEQTLGKIGNGQNFDGINDYIDTKDFDIDDNFSISIWIKPSSNAYGQSFIGKHTTGTDENLILCGYWEKLDGTHGYSFNIHESAHRDGLIDLDWHQMVYVGEKTGPSTTNITVYKNGAILWQYDLDEIVGDISGEKKWTIGQDWDYIRTDFFNGIMDEIRICNNIKNTQWITTEYNNQNNPSSFYTIGPEES